MNRNLLVTMAVATLLAAAGIVWAQSKPPTDKPDPRIDKLIEQNDQVLKNQEAILKKLDELQTGMTQLRRRSS